MKKLLVIFILVTVVVGMYSEENLLWCKKMLFNEPTKHIIQKGDYFSKLSKQYYGTTKYWRELALVNRAPNKDLVFPGEEVIIPNLDAVKKLHHSRSLTRVNSIVEDQKDWIAKNHNVSTTPLASQTQLQEQQTATETSAEKSVAPPSEEAQTEKVAAEPVPAIAVENGAAESDVKESSLFPIILTIVAIGLIVGVMAWYLVRRKRHYEMERFEPEDDEEQDIEMGQADEDEEFVPSFGKRDREDVLVD
ncbi:MAG: LysM peptidoglycan-binding domain-containing protein [Calditrichaeota bacterium]|nr:LysM peptidoglycan-binding domain-containing protein [Calditrichota bacterium]